ncbi:MAG: NIPSNAP family protein [Pirellulaceae bacterium]|nr:NIPSNAP family protein [Pirellulaceae bacterium]
MKNQSKIMGCACFAITWVCLLQNGIAHVPTTGEEAEAREFYELRIYQIFDFEKQQAMEAHLRDAYLPALKRLGIDRVGVFRNLKEENDHSVFVVIPFSDAEQFAGLRDALSQDPVYQKSEATFSDRPIKDPIYQRVESWFLKSFIDIPEMELSEYSQNLTPRIFELRLYESHTDDHARRKIKMFNEGGELQLMRDVEMAPVFFGETLIGPDAPNLVYMLSAKDEAAHQAHWKAFIASDRWKAMKDLPEYKDTVSKIQNWFLKPTDFSGF